MSTEIDILKTMKDRQESFAKWGANYNWTQSDINMLNSAIKEIETSRKKLSYFRFKFIKNSKT